MRMVKHRILTFICTGCFFSLCVLPSLLCSSLPGACGPEATLKKEVERLGDRAEAEKNQEEGFSANQDSQEVLPAAQGHVSARVQWHSPAVWSTGLCPQPGGKLSDDRSGPPVTENNADGIDFGCFAEGAFEGETYDEIEDGTGQVSQRPLLPGSPGRGQEFVLAPSELTWTQGALSSPSHMASIPPCSSPVPSSSSPPSHSPYAGKVHFCHCGKAFTLKSMRDRHVKMQHLNLRPFACPVCAKSFKMKHHLTKHVKTHGALRPYECTFCGKKIIWRDSFLKHQTRCQRLASRATGTVRPGEVRPEQDEHEFEYGGQVKVEQGEGLAVRGSRQERAELEQVLKEEEGVGY